MLLSVLSYMTLLWDSKGGHVVPKKVTYRATSPLYAGERYRVIMEEELNKISGVRIMDSKTSMVGQIESSWRPFGDLHKL
jgi:hypothetical protein